MKTSVRNFSLYKDDIRGETLAYPVVDDSHQYEPVRSLHPQFPLEKSKNQNIVRDCHYVVIHSFHVRTVFTRRKKMSYLPSHHVVQYLPCPAGSVVLHLLDLFKESKEKENHN